jgi:hypothetical protein
MFLSKQSLSPLLRELEQKCRALAASSQDEMIRAKMIEIAMEYDKLARVAEQMEDRHQRIDLSH